MTFLAAALLFALAQEDRATILDGVESWYQVVQDGKNKGYVHEKLERVKDQWTYAYRVDFEIAVKGGWHLEYRDVEATLDEEFAPETLKAAIEAGGADGEFSIATGEGRRTILVPQAGKEGRLEALPDGVHALPTLLFYSMRQSGRLGRVGPRSARLAVPRAEGRIVAEVSFEVGEIVRQEVAGKTGPVTPIRFLKPPPAARPETEWTEARVDKYGRLVEIALRGGAKFVLVADDLAAFRDAVNVHRSSRRDPIDKAAAMAELKKRSTPFPDEKQPDRVTADNLSSRLGDAGRRLEELRGLKGDGERSEAYSALLREWKAIRDKAGALGRPDVVVKVDELRAGAEDAWDGAAQARAAARRASVAIAEALDRVDLAALERELRALKESRTRLELQQRPELLDVLQWIAQAEPMLVRCRTRHELAKKAIVVTGTVLASAEEPISIEVVTGIRQDVRFVRDLSTAAINGRTYRAGELVEETGVRLEKVSSRSVTVSLRGELREVPIGGR